MLAFWILVCLLSALGVGRLRIETSTDSVLSRQNADWDYYQAFTDEFGSDEIIAIAVEGKRPFDPAAIEAIEAVATKLDTEQGVRRVDSLGSFPAVRVTEHGEIDMSPALDSAEAAGAQVEKLEEVVASDRILPGTLVSRDGRTISAVVRMADLGEEIDSAVVREVEAQVGELGAWVSGGPVFRTEANRLVRRDLARFVPLTVALIGLLTWFGLGGGWGFLIPLVVGNVGSVVVLGLMGWSGVPLSISTVILPSLLLALGCAYTMHVLWAAAYRDGTLAEAVGRVAAPVLLSGITTAVGFGALSLVEIDVVRYIGVFGAAGCLVVALSATTLAPAMLALFGGGGGGERGAVIRGVLSGYSKRWLDLIERRPKAVVAGWAAVTLVVGAGALRLNVETDVILYFPESAEIRQEYSKIRERLSGISPMSVLIEGGSRSVTDPEVFEAIGELHAFLAASDGVGKVVSIVDPVESLHEGFGGAGRPLSQGLIEQYLLVLESEPAFADVVNPERTRANVQLRVDNNGSNDLLNVALVAEGWWNEHGPTGTSARTTGIMHEYARSEREIERGQLSGLVLAFVGILVVLGAALRSFSLTLLTLVPNIVPVAFSFGIMGLAGIPLDAGTVTLATLALGIAVDDSIHIVTSYVRHRRTQDVRVALAGALAETLPAITHTTVVVAVGFGVLAISGFLLVQHLGLVTAVIMLVCYLADVMLLVALLQWYGTRRSASSALPLGNAS